MSQVDNTVSIVDRAELAAGVFFAMVSTPPTGSVSFFPDEYFNFANSMTILRNRLKIVDLIIVRARNNAGIEATSRLMSQTVKEITKIDRQGIKMAIRDLNDLRNMVRKFYTHSLGYNQGGFSGSDEFGESNYREACETCAWVLFCEMSEAIQSLEQEFKDVFKKD